MRTPLTREDLLSPKGRFRAWRELMVGDHGWLRKLYANTHEVSPGKVWRTYQPSPLMVRKWRDRGVKTIVNLRGDKPSGFLFLEEEACEDAGITLETLRLYSREAPTTETLHRVRTLFEDIQYPAVFHCKSGADRAGLMSVLYLFFHEGRPLNEAMAHLSFKYGHVKQGKTGVIDAAFDAYLSYANQNDISLNDVDAFMAWAQTDYDPMEIKARFKPSSVGSILTDVILRRE